MSDITKSANFNEKPHPISNAWSPKGASMECSGKPMISISEHYFLTMELQINYIYFNIVSRYFNEGGYAITRTLLVYIWNSFTINLILRNEYLLCRKSIALLVLHTDECYL